MSLDWRDIDQQLRELAEVRAQYARLRPWLSARERIACRVDIAMIAILTRALAWLNRVTT